MFVMHRNSILIFKDQHVGATGNNAQDVRLSASVHSVGKVQLFVILGLLIGATLYRHCHQLAPVRFCFDISAFIDLKEINLLSLVWSVVIKPYSKPPLKIPDPRWNIAIVCIM